MIYCHNKICLPLQQQQAAHTHKKRSRQARKRWRSAVQRCCFKRMHKTASEWPLNSSEMVVDTLFVVRTLVARCSHVDQRLYRTTFDVCKRWECLCVCVCSQKFCTETKREKFFFSRLASFTIYSDPFTHPRTPEHNGYKLFARANRSTHQVTLVTKLLAGIVCVALVVFRRSSSIVFFSKHCFFCMFVCAATIGATESGICPF